MKKITLIVCLVTLFLFLNWFPGYSFALEKALGSDKNKKTSIIDSYGKLPLSFEENQGQTDKEVRFLSRGVRYTLFLTPVEAVISLHPPVIDKSDDKRQVDAIKFSNHVKQKKAEGAVVRMKFSGVKKPPMIIGEERLRAISNYIIGNDPLRWHTFIPNYTRVKYKELYPGIDLVFYGNQSRLEYDFLVYPGSDPSQIRFELQGVKELTLNEDGNLVLRLQDGEVIHQAPVIYQEVDGKRVEVSGGYLIDDKGLVGFRLASWDKKIPLVIDPVLVYSTFLGGSHSDGCGDIAVDTLGNTFVTGTTRSTDFPLANASYPSLAGSADAFIFKLSADGSHPVYSTYVGGNDYDSGNGIAIDGAGNAYVVGTTFSNNLPLLNALYPSLSGTKDAFILKLSPDGSYAIYSTYLGGENTEHGADIALDCLSNVYVSGSTTSPDFPTVNAFDPNIWGYGGIYIGDAFIFKMSADGSQVIYSTYLGGDDWEYGQGITADCLGNAYVTGGTYSINFPVINAIYPYPSGPVINCDAFIFKLSSDGSHAIFSTYLGGNGYDEGYDLAVDELGYVYVTGQTGSNDFPIENALYPNLLGTNDAFIFKLNPDGNQVVYSTYLGGSNQEPPGSKIAVDNLGNAYVTGTTYSNDFPIDNALFPTLLGTNDAFVFKLNPDGNQVVYSTYLGGNNGDSGNGIAVDSSGNTYVAGTTSSNDIPTENALYPNLLGITDGFVAIISDYAPGTIIYPNGGESFIKSDYYDIKWSRFGIDSNVDIFLFKGEMQVEQLASNVPNTGSHPFNPIVSIDDGSDYRIKVSSADGTVSDFSDEYFTISSEYGELPVQFGFNTIDSPKSIEVPFQVTVYAKDGAGNTLTDYNGIVNLGSTLGRVSPIMAKCVNGEATVNLRVFYGGDMRLFARAYGATGYSNTFAVSGSPTCGQGTIEGNVVDGEGVGVVNADVSIYDYRNIPIRNMATTIGGHFKFYDMPCGEYTIKIEKDGVGSQQPVKIQNDQPIVFSDLLLAVDATPGYQATPVVLVPGFPGSSWINTPYPMLPPYDDPQNSLLKIYDPWLPIKGRLTGFTDLRNTLRTEGYYVVDCPWDWTLTIEQARKYLLYAIDKALVFSSTDKVHIVAHSAGGLLVRSYIQSDDFQNRNYDIDKFIMVGTPNLGSCMPYYMWEGGDPKLADDISTTVWDGDIGLINAYSNITQLLMIRRGKKAWNYFRHSDIRKFIRDEAPSLLQLMYTKEFLKYGNDVRETNTDGNINTWLKELNTDEDISRMNQTGEGGKVHVGILVGSKNNSTVYRIPVGNPDRLYEDGKPLFPAEYTVIENVGDGTVPYNSAAWPVEEGWGYGISNTSEEEHMSLITAYQSEIVNFLSPDQNALWRLKSTGLYLAKLMKVKIPTTSIAHADETINSTLSLSFNGSVRAFIEDPSGNRTGINPSDQSFTSDIQGSKANFMADNGVIYIENLTDGIYRVVVFGQYAKDFRISATYLNGMNDQKVDFSGFAEDQSFTFDLIVQAGQPLQIIPEIEMPQGLIANPCGEWTCLYWNPQTGVDHFNVYAAKHEDPYYAKIGSASGDANSFTTIVRWSGDASTKPTVFAVSAVDNTGRESLFYSEQKNDDRDHDGTSDVDEKIAGTYWTENCEGDSEPDGDVDGSDLVQEVILGGLKIGQFAAHFGRTDCP